MHKRKGQKDSESPNFGPEMLESAFEFVSTPLAILNRKFIFVRVNRAFARLAKRPAQEFPGRNYFEFFPSDLNVEIFMDVLKTKKRYAALGKPSAEVGAGEGTRFWEWLLTPVVHETETVSYLVLSVIDVTERERARAELEASRNELEHQIQQRTRELRESEKRFRALVMASSDVLYRMSPDWSEMIQLYSRGFLAETEEPSRTWLQKYIHPDDQQRVTEVINEAVRKKGIFQLEHRVRRADGILGWTFSRAIPILDEKGEIVEWFGAAKDITERKKAERDLRKAQALVEWLAQFPEENPNPVLRVSMDGTIIYCNPASKVISEWACGIGRRLPDPIRLVFDQAMAKRKESKGDVALDRSFYFVSVTPYPEKGYANIYGRDVTERKRAEEKLQQSERRFRNYFDMPFMGMAVTSPDKKWIEVNNKMCSILGYSREELLRKTWLEMTYPEDASADVEPFEKMLAGQIDSYLLEKRFIRKDGTIVWTNLAVGCIRNTDGTVQQFSASILDITERKRTEEELKKQTAKLEEANQELEAFTYSVSHDLQGPVRAIDGFAGMILKEYGSGMDAEFRRKCEVIRESTKLMGDTIDGLLKLSRVGRAEISMSKLNMNDLFKNVWLELETANRERNIELVQKELSPGYGDPTLIRQVFYNLLANAVKFTRYRKKAMIKVGSYVEDERVVYYIKDNGAGFDMRHYDKLFRVFQRLHTTSEFQGTGIGLAIVQRIVKRHSGQIWAEGKRGEGAVFYFSLPKA